MNKVIKGKRYDTETATMLAEHENMSDVGNFDYACEKLYKKRTGEFFLHCEGGPRTKYGVWEGNTGRWGEKIIPMMPEDAKAWVEKTQDGDTYEEIFGFIGNEKIQVCISLAKSSSEKLKEEAQRRNISVSELIERLADEL